MYFATDLENSKRTDIVIPQKFFRSFLSIKKSREQFKKKPPYI